MPNPLQTIRRPLRRVFNHPLTSKAPLGALSRIMRWQIRQRLSSRPYEFAWVNGARLRLVPRLTSVSKNHYFGLAEFEEMSFLMHLIRADDLFADIGANAGTFTVLIGAGCGADVLACEPVPATFAHLEAMIDLNDLGGRVVAHQAAAGSEAGEVRFTRDLGAQNHVVTGSTDDATITVPIRRLDDLLDRPATALKIDTEGHEREVLAGAPELLRDPALKAIVVELRECPEVHDDLVALGFASSRYDPWTRTLRPEPDPIKHNALYVRRSPDLDAHLRAAPSFRVLRSTI